MKTRVNKPSIDIEEAQVLANVTCGHGFHFLNGMGLYTGETTVNLFSFYDELKTIEPDSVMFHFQRRHFSELDNGTISFFLFPTNLTTKGA